MAQYNSSPQAMEKNTRQTAPPLTDWCASSKFYKGQLHEASVWRETFHRCEQRFPLTRRRIFDNSIG